MPSPLIWAKAGGGGSHEKVKNKMQARCLLSVCGRLRLESPMLGMTVVVKVAVVRILIKRGPWRWKSYVSKWQAMDSRIRLGST